MDTGAHHICVIATHNLGTEAEVAEFAALLRGMLYCEVCRRELMEPLEVEPSEAEMARLDAAVEAANNDPRTIGEMFGKEEAQEMMRQIRRTNALARRRQRRRERRQGCAVTLAEYAKQEALAHCEIESQASP